MPPAANASDGKPAPPPDVLTQIISEVSDLKFPIDRRRFMIKAGGRVVQVGDRTLTLNMIAQKLRGPTFRTGSEFLQAVEKAWPDIEEAYL